MQKTEIQVTEIVAFDNGLSLGLTKEGGSIPEGVSKGGDQKMANYAAGSAILSDAKGNLLCGPVDYQAMRGVATKVITGNDRARTMPGAMQMMAVALLACMHGKDAN